MLDLQLPTRYDWAVQRGDYGKLVVEPFEPGFALTVGIASGVPSSRASTGPRPFGRRSRTCFTSSRTCPE